MNLYVIYDSPRDYPGKIVVRRYQGARPDAGDPMAVLDSLTAARAAIQVAEPGAICFERSESDEPQIVETWT